MFSTSRGPNTKTQNRPNAGPRNSRSFRLIRCKGYFIFYNFGASADAETNPKCLFLCLKVTWQKQGNARISNHRASQQLSNGAFGSKLNLRVPICAGLSFDNFFHLSDIFWETFSQYDATLTLHSPIRFLFDDFFAHPICCWRICLAHPTSFPWLFLKCRIFLATFSTNQFRRLFLTTKLVLSTFSCIRRPLYDDCFAYSMLFWPLGKSTGSEEVSETNYADPPPNPYPLG